MHQFLSKDRLYIDKEIPTTELDAIKEQLLVSPHKAKVLLVVLPLSEKNQLEIMESKYLKQAYYERHPLKIVGIAKSMNNAKELVMTMTRDAIAHNNGANIREYLNSIPEE